MEETDLIKQRYERRKRFESADVKSFVHFVVKEREQVYQQILKSHFNNLAEIEMLEIGAGNGSNLFIFNEAGIRWENITANELLEDRVADLKRNCPFAQVIPGDALLIDENQKYDLIFQSTVFTSILDDGFKKQLAEKMWRLLKPGGIILWYDFTFNNPNNADVKRVGRQEIEKLFPETKNKWFKKVTLAPPIGRRVGILYPLFNVFSFLRTHLIAVIKK